MISILLLIIFIAAYCLAGALLTYYLSKDMDKPVSYSTWFLAMFMWPLVLIAIGAVPRDFRQDL